MIFYLEQIGNNVCQMETDNNEDELITKDNKDQ